MGPWSVFYLFHCCNLYCVILDFVMRRLYCTRSLRHWGNQSASNQENNYKVNIPDYASYRCVIGGIYGGFNRNILDMKMLQIPSCTWTSNFCLMTRIIFTLTAYTYLKKLYTWFALCCISRLQRIWPYCMGMIHCLRGSHRNWSSAIKPGSINYHNKTKRSKTLCIFYGI